LHVIALVITAIVMPVVLYWFFKWAANDLHDQAMRDQAQLVAHYLVLQADGTWTLDLPPALEDIYSQAVGRYAYAVVDDAGRVLLSSSDDRSAIFADDPRSSDIAYLETRRGKAAISGVSLLKEVDGRKVWVQVGEDLAHRDVIVDDIVADFFKRVGWITLPVLLSLLAIDIVIFRRALRPLLNASELAKKINPRRTDIRLPIEQMPKEILPLVQAVNQALDRLEAGFRVQREFTADAAHELRTPLTILRSRVDTLADRGTSKALHKDIEGMARVVNQLLDIAELEILSIDPLEKADLHAICAEVAEFAAPLALAQGKNIALSESDAAVWVNGNPEMLSRAIRNLVENAINYSPPGTTVEIVVEDSGMVRVLDEGPGIKEDERELIFQRFWRRDRRRTEGAGLGLSIVRRIADTHAATISVENRPTGGATFSLRFARIA
jgi:signal transduction histidine kinase